MKKNIFLIIFILFFTGCSTTTSKEQAKIDMCKKLEFNILNSKKMLIPDYIIYEDWCKTKLQKQIDKEESFAKFCNRTQLKYQKNISVTLDEGLFFEEKCNK